MDELRITVITWCSVLFLVCVIFLVFIKIWEKKHPQALTPKGKQREKEQYNQIITICMGTIFSFILLFLLAIANIGCDEPKPIIVYIYVALGFLFVASNIISSFRKK